MKGSCLFLLIGVMVDNHCMYIKMSPLLYLYTHACNWIIYYV